MFRNGNENVHSLHDELADLMIAHATVKRNSKDLDLTLGKLKELRERYKNITLDDHGRFANQTYIFANQFRYMLDIAMIIVKGALLRDEFRGAHYKEGFPDRDDKKWLKTTIATYDPSKDEPVITYEEIDMRHLEPVMRDYSHAKKVKPKLKNIPENLKLPI